LYQGNLFKLSVKWIEERNFDGWGILSAKHGLVMPDDILDPYEQRLGDDDNEAWGDSVYRSLMTRWGSSCIYTVLAGSQYGVAVLKLPYVENVFAGWRRQRKLDGHRKTGIGILMRELKRGREVG
jgi:hypothetical protein